MEGFFCGQEEKEDLEVHFPVYFLDNLEGKNCIAFRNGTLVVHKLKHSFVFNLWSWNMLHLGEEITSLIGFLVWLAAK